MPVQCVGLPSAFDNCSTCFLYSHRQQAEGGDTRYASDRAVLLEEGESGVWHYGSRNIRFSSPPPGFLHNPDIAPLSADFTFFGGLYRDVYLVYTSPVQLSTTHYASSGVYLKTVGITDAQAEVCAKTFLSNALKSNQALILETEILDADGNRVALSAKKVNVKAGEKNVAFEALMTIAQPKRWDVDSPYLYKVYSRLKNKKGEVLDCVVNPLGIREYHFDAEKGFFLNGKYRKFPVDGTHYVHQHFRSSTAGSR